MSRSRNAVQPEINVTPLVDVVLVLLIIFMVITPKMENGPSIELPPVSNSERRGDAKVEPLTVSIAEDGGVFFDTEAVKKDDVNTRLKQVLEETPERKLVLKGDRNAPYVHVRSVFKVCQDLGFKGVSLQVVERAKGT